MQIQTEYDFTLPLGYVDEDGTVHRQGIMRLATAMDEIVPLRDLRVRQNQAYLIITLLSRVIVQLGTLPQVTTDVIENLYAGDLAYLQAFYRRINEQGTSCFTITCPDCRAQIEVDLSELGGS